MPDDVVIYPTDNDYGIPSLPIAYAATGGLVTPFLVWGFQRRSTLAGTLSFYTDDYRFSALWSNPASVLLARPSAIVEPNFTVTDQTPKAIALWHTYRKRWPARCWGDAGIKLLVDLNVGKQHTEINLLGIPNGWPAFCTRGCTDDLEGIESDLKTAQRFNTSPLMVVYGGGAKVVDACRVLGLVHIQEGIDKRGK